MLVSLISKTFVLLWATTTDEVVRKKEIKILINWLILTCQSILDYFMPWSKGIMFIELLYLLCYFAYGYMISVIPI